MKWKSEFLFLSQSMNFANITNTHSSKQKEFISERKKAQSSQHRHWEEGKCLKRQDLQHFISLPVLICTFLIGSYFLHMSCLTNQFKGHNVYLDIFMAFFDPWILSLLSIKSPFCNLFSWPWPFWTNGTDVRVKRHDHQALLEGALNRRKLLLFPDSECW